MITRINEYGSRNHSVQDDLKVVHREFKDAILFIPHLMILHSFRLPGPRQPLDRGSTPDEFSRRNANSNRCILLYCLDPLRVSIYKPVNST